MNREIKFRGLQTDGRGWVYGYYFYDVQVMQSYIIDDESNIDVFSESVGQFTGLHDKNGKEIYEGDVLNGISNSPFSLGDDRNYKVIWGIDSWRIEKTYFGLQELFNFCNNNIEVIGNIYENPELL